MGTAHGDGSMLEHGDGMVMGIAQCWSMGMGIAHGNGHSSVVEHKDGCSLLVEHLTANQEVVGLSICTLSFISVC